jgi:putative ABC transport system permease protein
LGLFIAPDTTRFWSMRQGCNLFAKINPHTNLPSLLDAMQNIYKKYDKDTPFSYTFMDDAFNAQYKAEDKLASIFSIFTVITVLLAGMGLFGLAAFTIEQRTKEIGVRKILGASLSSIASLLSVDFLKLVLLAILIGSPIAWWAMNKWLQNFAYRINIQWWMFASAGLLAIIIALVTISYHALKAAVANPVNSLRSE